MQFLNQKNHQLSSESKIEFSYKEMECLEGMACGKAISEIATALKLQKDKVIIFFSRIKKKLGLFEHSSDFDFCNKLIDSGFLRKEFKSQIWGYQISDVSRDGKKVFVEFR